MNEGKRNRRKKQSLSPEQAAIDRITEMEGIMDEALKMLDNMVDNPEGFLAFQEKIDKLKDYYASDDWKQDFALDEAGKLPKDLKRGVLSEDGIYNVLEKNDELLDDIKD